MEPQRAASSLRLRDPRETDILPGLDAARVAAELADAEALPENALWRAPFWPEHRDPATYDHLVVAEDPVRGEPLALLGADVLRSTQEAFLFVNTAFVAPVARGRRVLRRMMVTALMQAARQAPVPRVIAARSLNPVFYRAMRRLARDFGVPLYPDADAPAVSLRAAALAARVAKRVSPSCRFEPGSAVLRGSVLAHGLQGAIVPLAAQDTAIDAMFERHLGSADQFLLVLDLRGLSSGEILETARRIRRRR